MAITHFKNRVKELSKISFDTLKDRRNNIVYMDDEGNVLWEEGVNYNVGVLAVPLPLTAEQWQQKNT